MNKIAITIVLFAAACGSAPVRSQQPTTVEVGVFVPGEIKADKKAQLPQVAKQNIWDGKSATDMCVDFAVILCDKVKECADEASSAECTDMFVFVCAGVTEVTEPARLYQECLPAVIAQECTADDVPESCKNLGI